MFLDCVLLIIVPLPPSVRLILICIVVHVFGLLGLHPSSIIALRPLRIRPDLLGEQLHAHDSRLRSIFHHVLLIGRTRATGIGLVHDLGGIRRNLLGLPHRRGLVFGGGRVACGEEALTKFFGLGVLGALVRLLVDLL